ncbi:TPA: ShlB/FhaC/HecB family hemolysin secretion/activation protein [Pasteurella multocida]|uniref:ShlB/FhaC/HecB family hemolysin secretion/activation protein n=1 Tax=Pasteurella multocida TaxID=747 RepID=UPI00061A674B|nr:ShlB/FhaC/HecB family hemolysin secretion/activation protein [Pasteurella multocida]AKD39983.1 LspB protein [Pasteurella multocida OH1905]URJ91812.1 ShlB/FhaC/HecB family hemolysin secretion/activation protein [Pasteurella multocida]WRK04298.1 ShlB/FhaC/HecB family hemolysin secretion/activation protein [Pasteurella multocida]
MGKYQSNRLNYLFLGCSATFLLCQSTLAYSQETNPLTQELLHLKNKQQFENVNENFKKAQQFLEDKQAVEEEAKSTLATDSVDETSKKITRITIDLGGKGDALNFDEVSQRYLNKPLSTKVVFQLVKDLTDLLYRSGYVTSAIGLKNPKIKNGDLEFVVLWGTVNDILVAGEKATHFRDKAMLAVLPNLKNKLLNVYDIDQMVEILNTTNKSAKVSVVASQEKGASNLNIERVRNDWPEVTLSINNSGTENNANGRNQASLNVAWSDLLGTNDRWSFSTGYRFYKHSKANQQRNYALSYVQPLSFSTLELKLAESEYKKSLQGENDVYTSSGKTQTATLKLSHVLLRNKETILSVYGELEFKKRLSYFSDIEIGDYHNNKLNIGLSYVTNLGYGKLYSDIAYANGLRWFGADYSAYDTKREKTLKLLSGSVNWLRPIVMFDRSLTYQARIGAQYGFDSLYSENQFSIGDEYTVRGFKGGAASGDSGAYFSQTLSIPFYPQKAYLSQISPFVGVDIGKVHVKQSHQTDTLAGFALGVKGQVRLFNFSFTYAQPLNTVRKVKPQDKKPVYYVSGSVSF